MQTQDCLENASGGVLFKAEAYRHPVSDSYKDYTREALETLMLSMLTVDPVITDFAGNQRRWPSL